MKGNGPDSEPNTVIPSWQNLYIRHAHKTSSQPHLLYYSSKVVVAMLITCKCTLSFFFFFFKYHTCFDSGLLLQMLIQGIRVVCHLALDKNGFGNTYYPRTQPRRASSESTTQKNRLLTGFLILENCKATLRLCTQSRNLIYLSESL